MSEETKRPAEPAGAPRKMPRCPICGRPRVQKYRPFCSARCRDVDLARWFGEAYAVPAAEPGYDEEDGEGEDPGR